MKRLTTIGLIGLLVNFVSAQVIVPASLKAINSLYDEQNPRISPDGRLLFFTIANHPQNMGGKRDAGDIWFSVFVGDGQWSAPVHAGSNLNNTAYNTVIGFSGDMSHLFLMGHYGSAGEPATTQGISVSRRKESGWSYPEKIIVPYFLNRSKLTSGYVTPDASVLVFSADSYESYGAEDLYVSVKNSGGDWSQPRHLGDNVNTKAQELAPFLTDDKATLYFASNGLSGFGSFDLFRTTRLGEGWSEWSAPENVSDVINTDARELFLSDYPALGLQIYTSTKDSDGYGDFRLHFPRGEGTADSLASAPTRADSTIQIIEVGKREGAEKEVRVYGKVRNADKGTGVQARLAVSQETRNWIVESGPSGEYELTIPSTDLYLIRIEASGYVSHLEKLDIHTYELKALELNFDLEPIAVGTTVNLKNILFEQGKTKLLPESYPELDLVAEFLKANPKVEIRLAGHTDNRGSPHLNHQLSQQRVDVVRRYLVGKGVNHKRITGKGYGGTKPIASNDSDETRVLNRRVEFTIVKD